MRSVRPPFARVSASMRARAVRPSLLAFTVGWCVLAGVTLVSSLAAAVAAAGTPSEITTGLISPPGGPPANAVEQPHSVPHTGGAGQAQTVPPPEAAVCTPITYMWNAGNYVYATITRLCTGPMYQQVQVCVQQKYEGSWHSSNSCRTKPPSGVVYARGIEQSTGGIQCTHGRPFRGWGWFYTPYAYPVTSEELVPNLNGEARC